VGGVGTEPSVPRSATLNGVSAERNGTITAVIFDIGGVLLDWNPGYVYREMFDDDEGMERFLSQVCTVDGTKPTTGAPRSR
jgi:hypothetical protein